MTEKAQRLLNKLRVTRLFLSPEVRDRALDEFNTLTIDPIGPLGGDRGMKVLQEMNDLDR